MISIVRRNGVRFVSVIIALLVAAPTLAGAKKGPSIEGITEYRLDNGLLVLLYPDSSKPTVTVNLTVFVGSRHEGYGETGMAHLLEHMVFKGTPDHPQIPKALQDRGARFNGTTWVDRTNYFETLPASGDNLEFAIRLEADRMVNSFVKQEDLLSEMTVVRNEFEGGENSPENVLSERVMSTAYVWHNYGKSTIGNRSDIERVPIKNLQAFYRKYYQPDNAMLVLAGKFESEAALALAEKYFGAIARPARRLDNTYTEEPAQDGERQITLRRVGELGLINAVYHVPAGAHPDVVTLEVLADILDTAPSGRLYKALVESRKAAQVSATVRSWRDPGVFELAAQVRRENALDVARDLLFDVTEKVGVEGVTEEEVERARRKILKRRELMAADTSAIAVELSEWAAQGDWRLYFIHRDRIEKVTPDDVKQAAARYFKRSNRTVGLFIPTDKPDRAPIPGSPDVESLVSGYRGREAIAAGEAFDVSPANIESRCERMQLADGIKAVLLTKKTRGETVTLRVVLRYGDLENLKGYEAAADFLAPMMTRGTKNLSRQQIQDSLDEHQATLTASSSVGTAAFTVKTKRAHLPAVLQLLRQVLREPSFPSDEFEVNRRQHLASLDEELTDPQHLAVLLARRTLSPYPKGDIRYNATVAEQIEQVKSLTLDQLKRLYDDFVGAQAGEVSVVGEFDREACLPLLRELFTGWNAREKYVRVPTKFFPDVKGGEQRILTPDKANAVYIGSVAFPLRDDDADYPALVIGNFVFGGGSLSSRLGDRVRQKEGLSYGIGSFLRTDSFDHRTSLSLFAISNPGNAPKVAKVIREELDRLLKDGVTNEELDRAKQGYLQQQQVNRTQDASLATTLTDSAHVGRTMAYFADLEKRIASLTPAQVKDALVKYVNPNRLVIVVAGDFQAEAGEGGGASSAK